MLFNAARFKSRFDVSGELLDLEEQDRSLWNKDLIALACNHLRQSTETTPSAYHYESSIAYLHCTAKTFESTDWGTIGDLYLKLLENNPNPFVELNYAIALYFSGKKEIAFDILNKLRERSFLDKYYLLNATLGKLNFLEGNYDEANEFYNKMLGQTNHEAEKKFVLKMIDKMNESSQK